MSESINTYGGDNQAGGFENRDLEFSTDHNQRVLGKKIGEIAGNRPESAETLSDLSFSELCGAIDVLREEQQIRDEHDNRYFCNFEVAFVKGIVVEASEMAKQNGELKEEVALGDEPVDDSESFDTFDSVSGSVEFPDDPGSSYFMGVFGGEVFSNYSLARDESGKFIMAQDGDCTYCHETASEYIRMIKQAQNDEVYIGISKASEWEEENPVTKKYERTSAQLQTTADMTFPVKYLYAAVNKEMQRVVENKSVRYDWDGRAKTEDMSLAEFAGYVKGRAKTAGDRKSLEITKEEI